MAFLAAGLAEVHPAASQEPEAELGLELTVTPASPQRVGQWVTVTARDPSPCEDRTFVYISFGVSGANPQSHRVEMDDSGTASFSYVGRNAGEDVITASVDYNPVFDPCKGSERATTAFTWTSGVPGDGCGSECIAAGGSQVSFTKSAGNPLGGVVVFECDAQAAGATQTSITSCTAGGVAAPRMTLTGPVAATAGAFSTSSPTSYEICWIVVATFSTGAATSAGCEPAGT